MVFQRNYAMLRGQRWPARRPVASALGSGPEADYTPVLPASSWSAARARLRTGIRTVLFRVLATMLAFTFGGLALAGVITYVLEFQELAGRTDQALQDKVQQIEKTARIGTPGQSGSLPNRLRDAVEEIDPRNHEIMAAFAGGQMRWKMEGSISDVLLPQGLVASATALPDPAGPVFASISAGKPIRVLVVPVRQSGQDVTYLLVGRDSSDERERIFASIRAYAMIAAATLAVAALVGGLVAGRLLLPLRRLREASAFVSHDDLTRRVDVGHSIDDVTDLARTFNTMLERLDRGSLEQHQFMDDAGHELRTPLTILRGHLELMSVHDAAEVAETRDLLLEEVDRMQRLVADLLLLAKARQPDFVQTEPVRVADFTHHVMDKIRVLGDRRWQLDEAADAVVVADPQRLTQALVQLAANAVKYTDPSSVIALGTKIEPAAAGGNRWTAQDTLALWMRDSGLGVALEDQHRIFERFGRAGTGRGAEGSGLGLAIAGAIAQAHGGRISVQSSYGHGSTFSIRIPVATPGGGPR